MGWADREQNIGFYRKENRKQEKKNLDIIISTLNNKERIEWRNRVDQGKLAGGNYNAFTYLIRP